MSIIYILYGTGARVLRDVTGTGKVEHPAVYIYFPNVAILSDFNGICRFILLRRPGRVGLRVLESLCQFLGQFFYFFFFFIHDRLQCKTYYTGGD